MKVLTYLWSNPPYRYAGAELATLEFMRYLADNGADVTVYSHAEHDSSEWNGIRIESSGRLHRRVAAEYDVFITHPEIRTNVWAEVKSLPYVAMVHNARPETMRSLDRCPPRLTIANSHYTRAHIPQIAVHSGLGVEVVHPLVTIQPKDGPHDTYGMVNISLEKGGAMLNVTASEVPESKFLGVLGGYGMQVMRQPSNVELVPQTPDMAGIYARMRALLFPTHSESYGRVVAEALVCGVPVIASDLPSIREVGGSAIQYLDPYDYGAWTTVVRMMNDDGAHSHWAGLASERGLSLAGDALTNAARYFSLIRAASQ